MIHYIANNKINAVFVPRDYSDVTLITEHNMQLITEHSFYAKNHVLNNDIRELTLAVLREQASNNRCREVVGIYQTIDRSIKFFQSNKINSIDVVKSGAADYILEHPANQLISLHNHPNNQYFSVGDVGVWVKYSQFIDSYIVTNDCRYQACLKKLYINNSINAWSLYRRYQMITYENNISMHQDADRILDNLIIESNTNLDYRAIVFQNY